MRRRPLHFSIFAIAAALSLFPAGAAAAHARTPSPPLSQRSPARPLTGGETATVTWRGLPVPESAEEWEAFLSLDGGHTFPIRLTPHLDLGVREFRFRVPDLPTPDGRILLRFGDEKTEVVVSPPERVTIAKGVLHPLPARIAFQAGESVLPGRQGVVFWTEGTRRGSRLESFVAAELDSSFRGVTASPRFWMPLAGPPATRLALPPPASGAPLLLARSPSPQEPGREPHGADLPVRLLIGRRNE